MFQTTNPERSDLIARLANALAEIPINGTATYLALNVIARGNVAGEMRHILHTARKQAERELGCVFESVRSVGIKRLTAEGSVQIGQAALRSVRRKSKTTANRLDRLNSNSMPDGARKQAIAFSAMLRTIAMMADGNKAKVVAAIVDPTRPIPPADILAMFATKGGKP